LALARRIRAARRSTLLLTLCSIRAAVRFLAADTATIAKFINAPRAGGAFGLILIRLRDAIGFMEPARVPGLPPVEEANRPH
jgi:hypothetical protein